MKRCALFSCMGLGDGLLALVLAHNLQLNGYLVDTFHPKLNQLQSWFPHLPIRPFPQVEELKKYDRFFLFYEKLPKMQEIMAFCQAHYSEKLHILNPIATLDHDYPYWEEGRFEGHRSMVDNLYHYCNDVLHLSHTTRKNGIVIPQGVIPGRFPNQVVIHPTSSRAGKNWSKSKYLALGDHLRMRGYQVAFALSSEEREEWGRDAPLLFSMDDLAKLVCESGAMIGNDSGVGHLASCLGLPTVTICRNRMTGPFWRPSWSLGKVIYPPFWVPNLKGFRLRDKQWQRFISVKKVLNAFLDLQK